MQRVREIILRADPRITEFVKYGTLTFAFHGDLATFVQMDKKHITLMFNRGARIPGRFPHLEGTGPTARFMRFAGLVEVEGRAAELGLIAASWCEVMSPASGKTTAEGGVTGKPATRAPAKASARPETLFDSIHDAELGRTGVTGGTGFGTNKGLRVSGKIYAMLVRGELVVKLPAERVAGLVKSGAGQPFDAGKPGRVMKEWVAVPAQASRQWRALVEEARTFVRAGKTRS